MNIQFRAGAMAMAAALLVIALPALGGQPWTTSMVAVERQGQEQARAVTDGRFDRDNFDGIGASARLHGQLFDAAGDYLVTEGDTWTWVLRQVSGRAGGEDREQVTYLGGPDRCWSFGHCGALEEISVTIGPRCMPNEVHEIRLYHNDERVGRDVFRPSHGLCVDRRGGPPAHAQVGRPH